MNVACNALIVGAGPAGLAAAACLTQRNVPFVIIEAQQHVGASWRRHYDRLCLHTTRTRSTLPGLLFPRKVGTYPSRTEVIAYLETYVAQFGIKPRFGEQLERARGPRFFPSSSEMHWDDSRRGWRSAICRATGCQPRRTDPRRRF